MASDVPQAGFYVPGQVMLAANALLDVGQQSLQYFLDLCPSFHPIPFCPFRCRSDVLVVLSRPKRGVDLKF
jgi:hypothetical protein